MNEGFDALNTNGFFTPGNISSMRDKYPFSEFGGYFRHRKGGGGMLDAKEVSGSGTNEVADKTKVFSKDEVDCRLAGKTLPRSEALKDHFANRSADDSANICHVQCVLGCHG